MTLMSNSNDAGRLAFALRGCRDLLEKLRFETGSLNTTERHDVKGRAYIAFNCAVTAWHMTDWVWIELDQTQRTKVQELTGTSCTLVGTNPKPLQEYARRSSPALKLCESIANGSKHRVLRQPPPVSTRMTDGQGADYGNPVVNEDGKEIWFGDVLWQAVCWWEVFLAKWHIAEEPPFVPEGDGDGLPFPLKRAP
jgi:hypothetical protein